MIQIKVLTILWNIVSEKITYFFRYEAEFLPFQNNCRNLDLSYKMDLDLWDCLGNGKTCFIAKFHRIDL